MMEMRQLRITKINLLIVFMGLVLVIFVGFIWRSLAFDEFDKQVSQLKPGMTKTDVIRIVGEPTTIDTTDKGTEIWSFRPPRGTFAEWPHCYFLAGDSIMSEFWWEPIYLTLPGAGANKENGD